MHESFLHYIWKYRLLKNDLITTDNQEVKIIATGNHNSDSGPDFLTSKVKIGNTLWAGNVEIHINTSDWVKHKHHKDKSYSNIILHVVYNNDKELPSPNNNIPTIEIKRNISLDLYNIYIDLINNKQWIPCATLAGEIDYFIWEKWKERLTIERLERKSEEIATLLNYHNNSWETAFYISLAKNFGLKVNSVPFELLAKSLPLKYLAKHKNSLLQIEALLFGQAGFLNNDFEDGYPKALKMEYQHLKNKFSLTPINTELWKFLRLRPANFPTLRISQFARLIHTSQQLFSYILEFSTANELRSMFLVKASEYWNNHYTFDKASEKKEKYLGDNAIDLIIINTVAPYIFHYGQVKDNAFYKEKVPELLNSIPAENNNIIRKWNKIGIKTNSAFQSQALIELKKNYCTPKKCLSCPIGKQIIK
ncbi:MAG: DUF2851 family protein [Bacteroidota bacterium]|nr:DUF2851 family protein [Bacteroidota bacterium]